MDVSGIFAGPHHFQAEKFVAVAATERSVAAHGFPGSGSRKSNRVDCRRNDALATGGDLTRLFEQAEWESSRDAKTDVDIATAFRCRASVGRDLCGFWADFQKETAFVGRLSCT